MAFPGDPSRPEGGTPAEPATSPGGAWAAPDTPIAPRRDLAAGIAAEASGAAVATVAAGPTSSDSHLYNAVGVRLPTPLRPMVVADVLDGSFTILKSRPRTIYGIIVPLMVPAMVLQALAVGSVGTSASFGSTPFTPFGGPTAGSSAALRSLLLSVGAAALVNLTMYLVGAGMARVVSAWYADGDIGPGEALRSVWKATPTLLGLWVIQLPVAIVLYLLSFCLIGLPLLIAWSFWLQFTAPIAVIEKVGPITALRRSWRLSVSRNPGADLGRGMRIIGISLLVVVVAQAVQLGLGVLAQILSALAFGNDGVGATVALVAAGVVSALVLLLVTPFVVGSSILLYLDQRVRNEGLDIELEAASAFR
ncbi:MAG: hypothetical protein KDB33_06520 [Acidimicrobiales bacterium]|nr:hypothetical protein [Acidimicrobiales bacterium]